MVIGCPPGSFDHSGRARKMSESLSSPLPSNAEVSLKEVALVFLKLGTIAFGGPQRTLR